MKLRYAKFEPNSPLANQIDKNSIEIKLKECEKSITVNDFDYSIYGNRIYLCRNDEKTNKHVALEFTIADETRPEVKSAEIDKYVQDKYEMYEKLVKCIMEPVENMKKNFLNY